MNNIETIRAEIKRLRQKNYHDADNGCNDDQCYGYDLALDDILSFLDTLEGNSEKPNNHEGLDEAAREYLMEENRSPLNVIMHEADLKAEFQYHKDIEDAFKFGAEWRDRQLNWARDLVQAGIDKPDEAVSILKRLKELI